MWEGRKKEVIVGEKANIYKGGERAREGASGGKTREERSSSTF